ncbi:MAG: hypothetical protein E7160_04075 [Firmicutes bacterium]|nr:hypothetical protein [Bacillota bacterium]
MKKKVRKILEFLSVIIVIIALFITFLSLNVNNLNYFEFKSFSLVPISGALDDKNEGLVISKNIDLDSLKYNDRITYIYYENNKFILKTGTIKSIGKQDGGVYTYVINPNQNKIDSSCVIGKYVVRIPLLGNLINYLLTRDGFLLLIVGPLLVVCIIELFNFVDSVLEPKNKRLK